MSLEIEGCFGKNLRLEFPELEIKRQWHLPGAWHRRSPSGWHFLVWKRERERAEIFLCARVRA